MKTTNIKKVNYSITSVLCTLLASPKLLSLGIVKVNFFSALAYSQLSLYSVLCSLFSVLCTLYSVLCTLFSLLCTLYSVLFTPLRPWIVAQEPYYNRWQQYDSANFFYVLCTFIPHMAQYRNKCRPTVGRQLHYKRCLILRELREPQQACRYNCHRNAKQVESHQHQCRVVGEECPGEEY